MRFSKAFPALLTALAMGFVGCEPEDDVDTVDPAPVVDPVDSTTTTTDPAWTDTPATDDVDAVIVAPAPQSGFGTAAPEPGLGTPAPEPGTAVPAPAPGASGDDAPSEEPLLQPDDSDTGEAVIEETP